MPLGFINASTPFNPTQISGVACALWLDGADSANIQLSGTAVTQWNDKSGNAGHATQSSSGNRPTFTGSGVVFNAASSQYLNLNTTFSSTHSIFIVATPTSASQVYLFGRSYASGHPTFILNYSGTALEYYPGGDGTTRTTLASPTSTFVAGYVRTFGTGVVARYNGNQVSLSGTPSTEASSIAWGSLGCSSPVYGNFYTGTIYEFIIYNTTLSAPQCLQIESYLSQKWGLVGNLPSNHPGIISRVYPTLTKQIMSPQLYYTAFKPTQIGGCALWLDGADPAGTGIVPAQDSQIGTWVDKSGNSRSMTVQGNSAYITYKKVNGINSVWFNNPSANNAYMKNTSFQVIQNGTVFMVFVPLAYSATWNFLWSWNPTASSYLLPGMRIQQNNSNLQFYLTWFGANNYGTVNNGVTYLSYFDWTNTSGTPLNWSINGTIPPTAGTIGSVINNTSVTEFDLGADLGGVYGNMYLSEMIIYNSVISSTQRQQVESYLAAKWGLTSSLPASHLHTTQPAGKPVAATQLFLKALPINIDATGGDTVVTANGYRTHTFTTVGSAANFVINSNPINTPLQVLVVAGGGGGGGDRAAGGGGGGLIFLSSTTVAVGTYNITVGAGGIPGWWGPSGGNGRVAGNGGNSVFNGNTAIGGGGAGQHQYWLNGSYQNYGEPYYGVGRAGGSGGGGSAPGPSYPTAVGGAPTSGQGYAGGSGYYNGSICCCGGGGGAGGVGGNGLSAAGGAGGPGLQITIGGSSAYYAGGGGGAAAQDYRAAVGGAGGIGGGGQADQSASVSGTAGTNGLGGGGGGAGNGSGWAGSSGLGGNVAGFAGGSGTVIIAYQYS